MIRVGKNKLTLYCENIKYGEVMVEPIENPTENLANLHFNIWVWSVKTYKRMLRDRDAGIQYIKNKNYEGIVASHPNPDKTWRKFIQLFGFSEPVTLSIRRF